ncbi:MAG: glutaredoxin-like protein NrdH [Bifidobacteriaceae bacterium]|jgi:glutaredoxin-like protein NrdH|nr:glutaredoxin-like protein NrdH [Bifidobacteriaceae bacterium]
MAVTVYSQPACPQCRATYRALDRQGTAYTVVDLTEDPHALDLVLSLGHRQAPVVVTESDHWSGFRPEKIAGLADRRVAA